MKQKRGRSKRYNSYDNDIVSILIALFITVLVVVVIIGGVRGFFTKKS